MTVTCIFRYVSCKNLKELTLKNVLRTFIFSILQLALERGNGNSELKYINITSTIDTKKLRSCTRTNLCENSEFFITCINLPSTGMHPLPGRVYDSTMQSGVLG